MYGTIVKPILDRAIALIGLILLSPLFILTALMLFLFQNRNVFFIQKRPGKNSQIFNLLKFATMDSKVNDKGELLPDDLRLTSIGKWTRKLSLDELPQLINVVKGDMSLVGPRPWLVEYLPLYNEYQRRRHEVRPGITGWAQVNGRNMASWEKRFEYDIYYVDNVSFFLDVKIIVRTIWNVLNVKDITAKGSVSMAKFTGNG